MKIKSIVALLCLAVGTSHVLTGCTSTLKNHEPTANEAIAFIQTAEKKRIKAAHTLELAWYISQRFSSTDTINHRNNLMNEYRDVLAKGAYDSVKFNGVELDEEMTLRLNRIRTGTRNPTPEKAEKAERLSLLSKTLNGRNSKGMTCEEEDTSGTCKSLADMSKVMATSKDQNELLQIWQQRQSHTKLMKKDVQEKIELHNLGAQRAGFENIAEMRSERNFQLPANQVREQLDRVWEQVYPLYESLKCHVSSELNEKFGDDITLQNTIIPAHLTGDLVSSDFSHLSKGIIPENMPVDRGYNLTETLTSKNLTQENLVKIGDAFHASMGFEPFDETFYKESLFKAPENYEAFCNGGYWWLYDNKQARVVQCMNVDEEGFYGPHNGLGLLHYDKESALNQPAHFRRLHRDILFGVVHAMNLSVTPSYLKEIGLLDNMPEEQDDIGYLMDLALKEVASIPFSLLVDKWRLAVASGEVSPEEYNQYWWQLREKYQGIAPADGLVSDSFEPGAVAAIINNQDLTPSATTFILKYQVHKNLCEAAGNTESLARCSIYNSKEAGDKLKELFNMAGSRTWSETLATWTNEKKLDGNALVEYFAPLQRYLDKQNKGLSCEM